MKTWTTFLDFAERRRKRNLVSPRKSWTHLDRNCRCYVRRWLRWDADELVESIFQLKEQSYSSFSENLYSNDKRKAWYFWNYKPWWYNKYAVHRRFELESWVEINTFIPCKDWVQSCTWLGKFLILTVYQSVSIRFYWLIFLHKWVKTRRWYPRGMSVTVMKGFGSFWEVLCFPTINQISKIMTELDKTRASQSW